MNKINSLTSILLIILVSLILIILSKQIKQVKADYYVEDYQVSVDVDKNKSFTVVEDIDVFFTKPSSRIVRTIPYENASVTDIRALEDPKVKIGAKDVKIVMEGSSKISGKHHYRLTYKYNYLDNKDEFIYNIIDTSLACDIKRLSFKVNLPEPIDQDGIRLYKNSEIATDSRNSRGVSYNITGSTISGERTDNFPSSSGLQLRASPHEGYFNKRVTSNISFIVLSLILLFSLLSFLVWGKYNRGKSNEIDNNEQVEGDINILEAYTVINKVQKISVLPALLLDLANRGYIRIQKDRDSFSITKLKDYPVEGVEKNFLLDFFKDSTTVTENKLESTEELKSSFRKVTEYCSQLTEKFYDPRSLGAVPNKIVFGCLIGIIYCITFAESGFNLFLFSSVNLYLYATHLIFLVLLLKFKRSNMDTSLYLLIAVGVMFWSYCDNLNSTGISYFISMVGMFCCSIPLLCLVHLPKRNALGEKLYAKLQSSLNIIKEDVMSNSIKTMELSSLYALLPYAYCFRLYKTWILKLKALERIHANNTGTNFIPNYDIFCVTNIIKRLNSIFKANIFNSFYTQLASYFSFSKKR